LTEFSIMRRTSLLGVLTLAFATCFIPSLGPIAAEEPQTPAEPIKPKPLADKTKKGLAYLVSQQHENGGWGQGGGWRSGDSGRVEGTEVKDPPDVANTAIATLALIRAGNTPTQGEYAENVIKGVAFIESKIESADADSPFVTDVKGTQLQSKIGQYVDTFLAALVLTELKGKMPEKTSEERLAQALAKTMHKIEKNQQADGTFAGNTGWASVLSQALCSKALNRAAQNGVAVKDEVLARDARLAAAGVDVARKDFGAVATATPAISGRSVGGRSALRSAASGPAVATEPAAVATAASAPSDAGIAIYAFSAKAGGLQDAVNRTRPERQRAQSVLADASAPAAAKEQAQQTLGKIADLEKTNEAAVSGILKRLDDQQFVAGFGNNGGEEFLSYMNISETLVARGGNEWETWDKSVGENLHRVQNEDGSWSGHHCITGRTFCTSAALLTLLADRAPVQVPAK
jgi:hypothetical protein